MRRITSSFAVVLLTLAASSRGQTVPVPKTNPTPVYAHYMPWFETPATLGGSNWGWHWTMNNRNPNVVDADGKRQIASYSYPTIGPYASSDPDVLEYHLLLMKLSGIDGVILDWYGPQGSNGDIPSLLNNSNAVADRVGKYGLNVSVMLEDPYARTINDPKANVAYLRDHYFNRPEYLRRGPRNDPVMTVFGPIKYQTPDDWTQILSEAGEDVELLPLWYESGDAGANADGEFAWIYEEEALDDHLARQRSFLNTRSKQIGTAMGVAYPGFQDFYAAGGAGAGVGFVIPPDHGNTLAQTLNLNAAYAGNIDMVQLATWNDFGEGTMLEPTRETGFTYLKQIQQFTGTPYGETELQQVLTLYNARKRLAGEAPAKAQLDRAADALNRLQFTTAANALRLADATAQIDRLFNQPAGVTTASTVAFDFNGDGTIVFAIDAANSDADFWARTLQHTEYGDANLDGSVNFDDLLILARNFKKGERPYGWTDGSFDGDGFVDFADLLLMAKHFGFANPSFVATSLTQANFDVSVLPEPAVMPIALVVFARHRRSKVR